MNNYKNLNLWNGAMDLVVDVYKCVKQFPKEEIYALTSQIKDSAVSIPSNIAEGAGRNSPKEFNNFLGIAYASCCELETQMILAHKLLFTDEITLNNILNKIEIIQKMTFNLQKTLKVKLVKE